MQNESNKNLLINLLSDSKNFPKTWVNDPIANCIIYNVDPNSDEYANIVAKFENDPTIDIIRIERIENKTLFINYNIALCTTAIKNNKQPSEIEKMYFHSTSDRYINYIATEGLDPNLAKLTGSIGRGVYFSESYKSAIKYVNNNEHTKHLLLCRVALGTTVEGSSGISRPSYLSQDEITNNSNESGRIIVPPRILGDATSGHIGNFKIYGIFERNRSYPEYIIDFVFKN